MKSPVAPANLMPSESSTVEVAAVSKLSLIAVDVEQQVVAEGRLREGLRRVAPVDVLDRRDAPVADAPMRRVGRAASGAPPRRPGPGERSLLNQGLRSGSPTGSRVVATRSFGSLRETGLRRERADERRFLPEAAGQGKACKADEGKAGTGKSMRPESREETERRKCCVAPDHGGRKAEPGWNHPFVTRRR